MKLLILALLVVAACSCSRTPAASPAYYSDGLYCWHRTPEGLERRFQDARWRAVGLSATCPPGSPYGGPQWWER